MYNYMTELVVPEALAEPMVFATKRGASQYFNALKKILHNESILTMYKGTFEKDGRIVSAYGSMTEIERYET